MLLTGLLLSVQVGYAQLKVRVEERYELTSIIFALAGVPEYCQGGIPSYFQDMVDEFRPYELSEPVEFVRELHQVHRIGYNAVPAAACMLEIKNGKISLQPKYVISKVSEMDSRWTEALFSQFITQLNIFYKESKFHTFFEKHKDLYNLAEQRVNEHIKNTATDWFASFFGEPLSPDIEIYISLTNGPNNYSTPDGVLLGMMSDAEGQPAPNANTTALLIHEISHHYTYPIFLSYWDKMKGAADTIYPPIMYKMAAIAYGDARTSMNEWFNNLAVLMYQKESKDQWFKASIYHNMKRGFIWMQRSVDFMEYFYADRDSYPYIKDFMPQLVSFLDYTAQNFAFVEREFEASQPYMTHIFPAPGFDITQTDEIVITFSEPMLGSTGFEIISEEGIEILPVSDLVWENDKRQIRLKLTPQKIEYGHTYGIRLRPEWFKSARYFDLHEMSKDVIFRIEHK